VLANFTYKMGHQFRIPVIQYEPLLAQATQVPKDWNDRWKQPGDEANTNVPAVPTSVTGLNVYDRYYQYADINVQTASHIRFRELLIHYDLPNHLLKKNPAAQFSVGLQIRNLATYSFNKEKLDPEYAIRENIEERSNIIFAPQPEYSLILRANF